MRRPVPITAAGDNGADMRTAATSRKGSFGGEPTTVRRELGCGATNGSSSGSPEGRVRRRGQIGKQRQDDRAGAQQVSGVGIAEQIVQRDTLVQQRRKA